MANSVLCLYLHVCLASEQLDDPPLVSPKPSGACPPALARPEPFGGSISAPNSAPMTPSSTMAVACLRRSSYELEIFLAFGGRLDKQPCRDTKIRESLLITCWGLQAICEDPQGDKRKDGTCYKVDLVFVFFLHSMFQVKGNFQTW